MKQNKNALLTWLALGTLLLVGTASTLFQLNIERTWNIQEPAIMKMMQDLRAGNPANWIQGDFSDIIEMEEDYDDLGEFAQVGLSDISTEVPLQDGNAETVDTIAVTVGDDSVNPVMLSSKVNVLQPREITEQELKAAQAANRANVMKEFSSESGAIVVLPSTETAAMVVMPSTASGAVVVTADAVEQTKQAEKEAEKAKVQSVIANPPGNEQNAIAQAEVKAAEVQSLAEADKVYTFQEVDDSYFYDAVFIGDSRGVGVQMYGGLDNMTFYCKKGLSIFTLFSKAFVKDESGTLTVEEALQKYHYSKIYLELGVNEMGTGTTEYFADHYKEVVEHLQELQPDAIVYICGIMYVRQSKSESSPVYSNDKIRARNAAIAALADNKNVFYLEINEFVDDGTGNLTVSYSADDVHLLGKYNCLWGEYLKSHAIVK